MPWSNIDDAYKIQNFNSDQGKRFYNYKMTETPFETYNIMEGFVEGNQNPAPNPDPDQILTQLKLQYPNININQILTQLKRTHPDLTPTQFLDKLQLLLPNLNINQTPTPTPTPTPDQRLNQSLNQRPPPRQPKQSKRERETLDNKRTQFLANKNNYTNRNIFVNKNDDPPDSAVRCISRNNTTSSTNTVQYNSHNEAKIACKLRALNNSPQHSVYTINAINTGTNVAPSYKYSCSTSATAPTATGNANTITNKTLYSFIRPTPYSIPIQTKFILSTKKGNYEYHRKFCKDSNGKYTMASITSQADYDGIMRVFDVPAINNDFVILGGYRNDTSDANRAEWNWEDGSRWDNDIANRKKITNCGWGTNPPSIYGQEPNDWTYALHKDNTNRSYVNKNFGQHVLVLRPYGPPGLWDDHFRSLHFYAIYKELYEQSSVINYSAVLSTNGTLEYNVPFNSAGTPSVGKTTSINISNNITLPEPISGCSSVYGGGINKNYVKLKYTFGKCT